MLNFTHEDDVKTKNKHVTGVSRTYNLSIETISRSPQSRETIPLRKRITLCTKKLAIEDCCAEGSVKVLYKCAM
jgi:hypothetical protein